MGFFDDLAMGVGAKAPTKDYEARTAATMERNRNPGGAQQYRESRGVTSSDIGNMSPSTYQGSGFFGGYTSGADLIDGGGPGRSGARFSSGDTGAFAGPRGTYVSEAMYNAAEQNQPDAFAQTQGGIASLTNRLGFRPRGSYGQESNLRADGTNIGTSGLGSYLGGGGMIGDFIRDGAPSSSMQVDPNVPLGARLDPETVGLYNYERMPQRRTLLDKLNLVNKPLAAPGMEFARGGIVSLGRR
jgi:hypothetical protein